MKQTTETFCTTVGRKMMWVYLWSIKWCVICPWIFNYCQIRLPSWLLHAFLNISLGFRWTPASGLTSLRAPRTWWGACWCLTLLRESLSMRLSTTPGWRQDHKTHTHTHAHTASIQINWMQIKILPLHISAAVGGYCCLISSFFFIIVFIILKTQKRAWIFVACCKCFRKLKFTFTPLAWLMLTQAHFLFAQNHSSAFTSVHCLCASANVLHLYVCDSQ